MQDPVSALRTCPSELGNVEHHGHRLDGRFDEAMVSIKVLGILADGVAEQGADTHLLGQPHRAQHRVLEQPGADTATTPARMNGQAAENGYRDRLGHVAPNAARRLCVQHRPGRQRVVTDDLFIRTGDERARSPVKLILEGALFEPAFEFGLDTPEGVETMRRVQRDRRDNFGAR